MFGQHHERTGTQCYLLAVFNLAFCGLFSNSFCLCFLFVSCIYKFGDLDPGSAEFYLQEERIKQLRTGYEAQYRVILLKF